VLTQFAAKTILLLATSEVFDSTLSGHAVELVRAVFFI
jgi:hypothetical protein